MKTLQYVKEIDKQMNMLTQHSLTMEKDNMLMKKALRVMAQNICLTESGETTFDLKEEDVEFIKSVFDTCNVFGLSKQIEGDK